MPEMLRSRWSSQSLIFPLKGLGNAKEPSKSPWIVTALLRIAKKNNNNNTAPVFLFTHSLNDSSESALFLLKRQIPRKVMFHFGLECFLFLKDLFYSN